MPATCRYFRRFNDQNVPEAEVNLVTLNVRYRDTQIFTKPYLSV